uniref:Uncharacterized protein n=1 Tax=Solanum lycopersicum TaxID=4081 RepID=A0A3Q7HRQ7_SOLLC
MIHISDIKLIRTDTTLDLSQKAEKGPKICTRIGGVRQAQAVVQRMGDAQEPRLLDAAYRFSTTEELTSQK